MKSEAEIRDRLEEQRGMSVTGAGPHAKEARAYDNGFVDALEFALGIKEDDAEGEATEGEDPELGDVVNFPDGPPDRGRRWIVMFEEDYDDFIVDVEDNVGVLVDIEQAGELLRLSAETIAALSPRDAEADDVIRDMRDALDRQLEGRADD